ncbi:MAG TPA: hypothetical protein VMV92_36205 [Streptosporangiaceae bacterium]|nr:hypothetical protein [Streptosporangiaceae bacterium]
MAESARDLGHEWIALTDHSPRLTVASGHVLGHCTGRLLAGRGRPESVFDPEAVFSACRDNGVAVEINCRPERQDPPDRLLRLAAGAAVPGLVLPCAGLGQAVGEQFVPRHHRPLPCLAPIPQTPTYGAVRPPRLPGRPHHTGSVRYIPDGFISQ